MSSRPEFPKLKTACEREHEFHTKLSLSNGSLGSKTKLQVKPRDKLLDGRKSGRRKAWRDVKKVCANVKPTNNCCRSHGRQSNIFAALCFLCSGLGRFSFFKSTWNDKNDRTRVDLLPHLGTPPRLRCWDENIFPEISPKKVDAEANINIPKIIGPVN